MPYLEICFYPVSSEEDKSFLVAELMEAGFDSFSEEEDQLLAYIDSGNYANPLLEAIPFLKTHPEITFKTSTLEEKNWNREWETNYEPVTIDGKCHVRAPFHPALPGFAHEIVIEPKMSFGTAHHETTRLMASRLMRLEVKGKEVLDMGCGTGILAILANKMGALHVTGIDNDEWAYRNAMENFRLNGVTNGKIIPGDASLIEAGRYDLILANINRNVLTADMQSYCKGLRNEGLLLLSGFYDTDIEAVTAAATHSGLQSRGHELLSNWAVLLLAKLGR